MNNSCNKLFWLFILLFGFGTSLHAYEIPWKFSSEYLKNTEIAINAAINNDFILAYYYAHKTDLLIINLVDWIRKTNNNCYEDEVYLFSNNIPKLSLPVSNVKQVTISDSLDDISYSCRNKKESVFLNHHHLSKELYIKVVEKLLWQKQLNKVENMLTNLPAGYAEVVKTRIALQKNSTNAQEYFNLISLNAKSKYFGLMYDYVLWYMRNQGIDRYIIQVITSLPYSYKYKHKLWYLHKYCIREIIYKRQKIFYKDAYNLARICRDNSSASIAESRWLSGWIALQFLDDFKSARVHFKDLYKNSRMPISLSRAAYWLGRVFEQEGKVSLAFRWYKVASSYQTTFYGQLALLKTGLNNIKLNYNIKYTDDDYKNVQSNYCAKIAYLLFLSKEYQFAEFFIANALKNAKSIGEIAIIAELSQKLGLNAISMQGAKTIENHGYVIPNSLYPNHENFGNLDRNSDIALILSIVRQESRFNSKVKSSMGAVGLMQLMPYTAKTMADKLKIKYEENNLINPKYNIMLGYSYVKEMLNNYNSSLILAFAAYNAGPHNVDKWIKDMGNPLSLQSVEELIDWVESIPFNETRNYVQRVIENLQVYDNLYYQPNSNNKNYFFRIIK